MLTPESPDFVQLRLDFMLHFGYTNEPIHLFMAPGRINLIGEHTDYNGGCVMPAALTLGSYLLIRRRNDDVIRLADSQWPSVLAVPLDRLMDYRKEPWGNYQLAVAEVLQQQGGVLHGVDCYYHETVPLSSGLSSSAAIEVVTATALNQLFGLGHNPLELAQFCQAAERDLVGVSCGIMDQFASACGQADHAMLLHCETLEAKAIAIHFSTLVFMIANSKMPRSLLQSPYNQRLAECQQALKLLQQQNPQLAHLCQATTDTLHSSKSLFTDSLLYRRARHVITENQRVLKSVQALQKADAERFGTLMLESHASLRSDYQVTGEALDCLVEAAQEVDGVLGSRMTGAGFGGCTIHLMQKSAVSSFCQHVRQRYTTAIGLEPIFYQARFGPGAREL